MRNPIDPERSKWARQTKQTEKELLEDGTAGNFPRNKV